MWENKEISKTALTFEASWPVIIGANNPVILHIVLSMPIITEENLSKFKKRTMYSPNQNREDISSCRRIGLDWPCNIYHASDFGHYHFFVK